MTAPIIVREQPDSSMLAERAVELKLDAATLKQLDELFPGHKPAPEDYAW